MLNWLISPSESFSFGAEIVSDAGLALFTVVALTFVAAEYAAEHLSWPWGHERRAVFAVLVIIGFSGELFFEMGSFRYSYALQGSQAQTIEGLRTKAEAAKSAADAALDIANTAKTNAQDATATLDALKTQEEALSNEIAKIRARERPRHLSKEQAENLKISMTRFKGTQFAVIPQIVPTSTNTEQGNFADNLRPVLQAAGWIVTRSLYVNPTALAPASDPVISDRGCIVVSALDQESRAKASTLRRALGRANIDCQTDQNNLQRPGTIEVDIGLQ